MKDYSLTQAHVQPHIPFDKAIFKLGDVLAREIWKRDSLLLGHVIIDHTNPLGVDLYCPELDRFFEVGIKFNHWDFGSEKFPFRDLSVEARKKKYLTPEEESEYSKTRFRENLYYIYFSGDLKWYIICNSTALPKVPVWRPSSRNPDGEFFFHVDIKDCEVKAVNLDIGSLPAEVLIPYINHQIAEGKRLWPAIPTSYYEANAPRH